MTRAWFEGKTQTAFWRPKFPTRLLSGLMDKHSVDSCSHKVRKLCCARTNLDSRGRSPPPLSSSSHSMEKSTRTWTLAVRATHDTTFQHYALRNDPRNQTGQAWRTCCMYRKHARKCAHHPATCTPCTHHKRAHARHHATSMHAVHTQSTYGGNMPAKTKILGGCRSEPTPVITRMVLARCPVNPNYKSDCGATTSSNPPTIR